MKNFFLHFYLFSLFWFWVNTVRAQSQNFIPKDSTLHKLQFIVPENKTPAGKKLSGLFLFLNNSKLSLGKTFSGTERDLSDPANFFLYKNFYANTIYWVVDAAVKQNGLEFFQNSLNKTLTISPKIEWHKNGDTTSKNSNLKNSLYAGLNLDFTFLSSASTFPFIVGGITYQNNFIKKAETYNLMGYLSLFSNHKFFPGSLKIRVHDHLFFRYYLFSGFEYYHSNTYKSFSTQYWASKINAELNIIPKFVQLLAQYSYRVSLEDQLYTFGNTSWLSLGLNYFIEDNIGIGASYNSGYDPNNSFTKTKTFDFGIKVGFKYSKKN